MDDSTSQISQTIDLNGCLVTEERLRRIDLLARNAISNSDRDSSAIEFEITATPGGSMRAGSVEEFLEMSPDLDDSLLGITIEYRLDESSAIRIEIQGTGETITVSAFGAQPKLEYNVGRLVSEIQACDQRHNWIVRGFLVSRIAKALLIVGLILASLTVLYSTGYYLYARSVGVNIDASLIVENGREYAKEVERAIKSPVVTDKLDVLLRGQLRGFTNVKDVLVREEAAILRWSFVSACLVVLLLIQWQLGRLYPRAFFAFGRQKEKYVEIVRRRDMWVVGIFLAFAVNILAGLLVAYLV